MLPPHPCSPAPPREPRSPSPVTPAFSCPSGSGSFPREGWRGERRLCRCCLVCPEGSELWASQKEGRRSWRSRRVPGGGGITWWLLGVNQPLAWGQPHFAVRKHIFGTHCHDCSMITSCVAFVCRGFGGFIEKGVKIKRKGPNWSCSGKATLHPKSFILQLSGGSSIFFPTLSENPLAYYSVNLARSTHRALRGRLKLL